MNNATTLESRLALRAIFVCGPAQKVTCKISGAVAYVTRWAGGRVSAVGFRPKAGRPAFNYSFRSETAVAQYVAKFFESQAARAKARAERKPAKVGTAAEIYARALEQVGQNQRPYLGLAETAVLVRAVLAKNYPGKKFSVRSRTASMMSAIDVRCPAGVNARDVDSLLAPYAYGRFDGSIDLSYSVTAWLTPDGSAHLAHSQGTAGSRGSHDEIITSPIHPNAIEVSMGAKYVSAYAAN